MMRDLRSFSDTLSNAASADAHPSSPGAGVLVTDAGELVAG